MSALITKTSTADEAHAAHQIEKAARQFPLEHRQLQSCTEADRTCPGWDLSGCVNGGDEPDEGEEICFACVRAEDNFYRRAAQEKDRREAIDSGSQYQYLADERRAELRAARDSQIPDEMGIPEAGQR